MIFSARLRGSFTPVITLLPLSEYAAAHAVCPSSAGNRGGDRELARVSGGPDLFLIVRSSELGSGDTQNHLASRGIENTSLATYVHSPGEESVLDVVQSSRPQHQ